MGSHTLAGPMTAFLGSVDVDADGEPLGLYRKTHIPHGGNEQGVFLVPGSAFGAPGHLRLSYGLEDARLAQAFARLADAV